MGNKTNARELLARVPRSARELNAWSRRLLAAWSRQWATTYLVDPPEAVTDFMREHLPDVLDDDDGLDVADRVKSVREFMRLQLHPHRGAVLRLTFEGGSGAELYIRKMRDVDFARETMFMGDGAVQAERLDGLSWNANWANMFIDQVVQDLRHDGIPSSLQWRIHPEDPSILYVSGKWEDRGAEPRDDYRTPDRGGAHDRALLSDKRIVKALRALKGADCAHVPLLRRKLGIAPAEAERLLDRLVAEGIVGACGEILATLAGLNACACRARRRGRGRRARRR